jgi:hypothetical protein
MPDRATGDIDGFLPHGLIPLNCDGLAKCLGIAGENPLSAPSSAIDKMRRVLRNLIPTHDPRWRPLSKTAAFEARCTDCNRPDRYARDPPPLTGGRRRLRVI